MPGQSEPTLFSTAALNLPKTAAWPMPARGRINRLSAKGTGRVLFAIVDGRITAAIGFTLKFKPIVAYVLAAEAELPAQGLRNLRAAKACLHYMAAALRRPPEVYFDAPPQTVTIAKDRLLFKDAGAAHDVRAAGKLLVQGAPDEGA